MNDNVIRLDDLAHPVLNDVERQFVETAAAVEMTEEAVLSAAREKSGLSDEEDPRRDFEPRGAPVLAVEDRDPRTRAAGILERTEPR